MYNKYKILGTLICLMVLSSCEQLAEISGSNTLAINAKAAEQYEVVKNQSALVAGEDAERIKKIMNRLQAVANEYNSTGEPFNWEVIVIKKNEVNAWCMPGGKMAVYTGLLKAINPTDAELAAIMGHEMAHALKEHIKQQAGLNAGIGVGLQAIAIAGKANANVAKVTGVLDKTGATSILVQLGTSKFSRTEESEADAVGVMMMAKAGYDPNSALKLWKKMQSLGSSSKGPSLFSSHPTDKQRIEDIEKLLPEALTYYQSALR